MNVAQIWSHGVELAISLGILALLVLAARYAIRKTRAETLQHELPEREILSKFVESHTRGDLSDAEFRTIKTTLAEQLQNELRDDGQTG
ncbi:MAG: hypothetical protein JXM70_13340 [Pirellulales bacterium]|nr:hypothetical protein [Pirellulales bacterium]